MAKDNIHNLYKKYLDIQSGKGQSFKDGGEVKSDSSIFGDLADKLKQAFSTPPPPKPHEPTLEEKYAKIRADQDADRNRKASDYTEPGKDLHNYAKGGQVKHNPKNIHELKIAFDKFFSEESKEHMNQGGSVPGFIPEGNIKHYDNGGQVRPSFESVKKSYPGLSDEQIQGIVNSSVETQTPVQKAPMAQPEYMNSVGRPAPANSGSLAQNTQDQINQLSMGAPPQPMADGGVSGEDQEPSTLNKLYQKYLDMTAPKVGSGMGDVQRADAGNRSLPVMTQGYPQEDEQTANSVDKQNRILANANPMAAQNINPEQIANDKMTQDIAMGTMGGIKNVNGSKAIEAYDTLVPALSEQINILRSKFKYGTPNYPTTKLSELSNRIGQLRRDASPARLEQHVNSHDYSAFDNPEKAKKLSINPYQDDANYGHWGSPEESLKNQKHFNDRLNTAKQHKLLGMTDDDAFKVTDQIIDSGRMHSRILNSLNEAKNSTQVKRALKEAGNYVAGHGADYPKVLDSEIQKAQGYMNPEQFKVFLNNVKKSAYQFDVPFNIENYMKNKYNKGGKVQHFDGSDGSVVKDPISAQLDQDQEDAINEQLSEEQNKDISSRRQISLESLEDPILKEKGKQSVDLAGSEIPAEDRGPYKDELGARSTDKEEKEAEDAIDQDDESDESDEADESGFSPIFKQDKSQNSRELAGEQLDEPAPVPDDQKDQAAGLQVNPDIQKFVDASKSSNNDLKEAQRQRDENLALNQMQQGAALFGSGLSRTDPSQALGMLKEQAKYAGMPVEKYNELVANQSNDPNSTMSKVTRDYLTSKGIKVPENSSYNDLSKILPILKTDQTLQFQMSKFLKGEEGKNERAGKSLESRNTNAKLGRETSTQNTKLKVDQIKSGQDKTAARQDQRLAGNIVQRIHSDPIIKPSMQNMASLEKSKALLENKSLPLTPQILADAEQDIASALTIRGMGGTEGKIKRSELITLNRLIAAAKQKWGNQPNIDMRKEDPALVKQIYDTNRALYSDYDQTIKDAKDKLAKEYAPMAEGSPKLQKTIDQYLKHESSAGLHKPGDLVQYQGKNYKVGADGDSLEEIK